MCNFLSALVLKNGDILTHPMLDSHSDLVRYFKLPDTNVYIQHFAKVELVPKNWADPATWAWTVDEQTLPAWWKDVENQAETTLRIIAAAMILKHGYHDLIVDGCWIVTGIAEVINVQAGRIMRVQESAQIRNVCGSAQIHSVYGSAQINGVYDSAQIRNVRDSAQIHHVRDSAQIRNVSGSAQINDVGSFAQIYNVSGSAQINGVYNSAQIRNVSGSAQIYGVYDSVQIHNVYDSAQINHVRDSAQIRNVSGSAILDDSAKVHVIKEVS